MPAVPPSLEAPPRASAGAARPHHDAAGAGRRGAERSARSPRRGGARGRRYRPRHRRRLPWPLRLVRALAVGAVLLVLAYLAAVAVEVEAAARRQSERPADAAVVMGAAQYDGVPSGALAGRLDRAAALYTAGQVDRIIVTGGNQPGDRTTEGMTGFVYLRELGVPEEALLVENTSTNTWEQLLATKLILDEHDIDRVILVSDPYHNRRLLGTAAELGIDADVAAADSGSSWRDLGRETFGVAAGQLIGFRRLAQL